MTTADKTPEQRLAIVKRIRNAVRKEDGGTLTPEHAAHYAECIAMIEAEIAASKAAA